MNLAIARPAFSLPTTQTRVSRFQLGRVEMTFCACPEVKPLQLELSFFLSDVDGSCGIVRTFITEKATRSQQHVLQCCRRSERTRSIHDSGWHPAPLASESNMP